MRRRLIALAVAASVIALAPAATAASAPTLGRSWAPSQQGYGHVAPRTIFNGGDPTGLVKRVRWSHWGAARAIGHGIGDWVWPGQSVAAGSTAVAATVVAWDLGSCHGKRAYRKIDWYFPTRGDAFDPRDYINICTGRYAPSSGLAHYAKCGSTPLSSPPGYATQIQAVGVTCARARGIITGTPSKRYVRNGGRFRAGRLYCGSEGDRSFGPPALFECAWGPINILYDVS